MAKKDGKKGKGKQSRAEQVRSAVDQAFEATTGGAQQTRERAVQVADELSQSIARFREVLDDARPVSAADISALRDDLAALTARVEKLEAKPKPAASRKTASRPSASSRATAARSGTAAKAAAARTAASGARKPAARGTSASRSPARKPAAGS